MGKIATRAFCNTLKAGAFSSELTRCPTRSEIETAGLTVAGAYATNQLVMEEDIKTLLLSLWLVIMAISLKPKCNSKNKKVPL